MKVLIFGGDGFCGWLIVLYFFNLGYDIVIVDNLLCCKIDIEFEVELLMLIWLMSECFVVWKEVFGCDIKFVDMNIGKDYQELLDLIVDEDLDIIVYFVEQ